MPLYKLTSKRLARQEKAERIAAKAADSDASSVSELDSDDDTNVLSDEDDISDSDSDSDSEPESDDEESDSDVIGSNKRKRGEESEAEDSGLESGAEDDSEEEVEMRPFTLTIEEVESAPLFAPLTSDWPQFCVLCPDRVLKHEVMAKVHLDSNAHKRAVKRWTARLAAGNLPSTDPREIVEDIQTSLAAAKAPKPVKTPKAAKKAKAPKAPEPEPESESEDEEEEESGAESDDEATEAMDVEPQQPQGGAKQLNRRQRRALARAAEGKPVEGHGKERRQRHIEAKKRRKEAAKNKAAKAEVKAEAKEKAEGKKSKKARKALDL